MSEDYDGGFNQYVASGGGLDLGSVKAKLQQWSQWGWGWAVAIIVLYVLVLICLITCAAKKEGMVGGGLGNGGAANLGQDALGGSNLVDTNLYGPGNKMGPLEYYNKFCQGRVLRDDVANGAYLDPLQINASAYNMSSQNAEVSQSAMNAKLSAKRTNKLKEGLVNARHAIVEGARVLSRNPREGASVLQMGQAMLPSSSDFQRQMWGV